MKSKKLSCNNFVYEKYKISASIIKNKHQCKLPNNSKKNQNSWSGMKLVSRCGMEYVFYCRIWSAFTLQKS